MLYGKYQFLCRLSDEAILPFYKGSTYRGVFGHALKRVVCALRREDCESCLLNPRCLYVQVFETPPFVGESKGARMPFAPHPFVIEPPLTSETHFLKGSAFNFNLLLFGQVNESLPYFIYAFEQMGRIGIGKSINRKRSGFVLEEVWFGERRIYSHTDQKLQQSYTCETLSIQNNASLPHESFGLKVDLETPLRLKFGNRLSPDLPFHVLVRGALRRVSSLLNFYGDGEPPLDYRGLVKDAATIRILDSDLKWYDWERYSIRQERAMFMGGLLGSVTYEGNLRKYMPLIDFCSKVHLGKQSTFGLGKIRAEIV